MSIENNYNNSSNGTDTNSTHNSTHNSNSGPTSKSSGSSGGGGSSGSSSGGSGATTKRSNSEKGPRMRTVLSEQQLQTLRTVYATNQRPDALMKEHLVEITGLSPRVIRVWFQNKRCKDKKKAIQHEAARLQQQQQQQQQALQGGSSVSGCGLQEGGHGLCRVREFDIDIFSKSLKEVRGCVHVVMMMFYQQKEVTSHTHTH